MTIDSESLPQSEAGIPEEKAGGNVMSRSAWQIWWHPVRSRNELAALAEEAATLRDLLARTERERERLMQESRDAADRQATLTARREEELRDLKSTIARLESEGAELNKELGEWRQTRMELDAIAERMKEWESVKERYEERIKMLTLRLRDALGHKNPGRQTDRESDILEEGENPYLTPEERANAERRRKDADIATRLLADFLPDEPAIDMTAERSDSSAAPADTPAVPSRNRRSAPGARRLPKDDSDWLISLPPE